MVLTDSHAKTGALLLIFNCNRADTNHKKLIFVTVLCNQHLILRCAYCVKKTLFPVQSKRPVITTFKNAVMVLASSVVIVPKGHELS